MAAILPYGLRAGRLPRSSSPFPAIVVSSRDPRQPAGGNRAVAERCLADHRGHAGIVSFYLHASGLEVTHDASWPRPERSAKEVIARRPQFRFTRECLEDTLSADCRMTD